MHYASTQEPLDSKEEHELEEAFLNAGVHVDGTPEMDMNDNVSGPSPPHGKKRGHSTSVPERARHSCSRTKETEVSSAFQGWTKHLTTKMEALLARANRYKEAHEATSTPHDPYSTGNCIDILKLMEGYDNGQFLLAIDKLTNSEVYRQTFIHLSEPRRVLWVNALK